MLRQSRSERDRNTNQRTIVTIAGMVENSCCAQLAHEVTSPSLTNFRADKPTWPVFHAKCNGLSQAQVRKMPTVYCSQHNCTVCERNTSQAGGMLFRYVHGQF